MPRSIALTEAQKRYRQNGGQRRYRTTESAAESIRRYQLKRDYGVTPEEKMALIVEQRGFCANTGCNTPVDMRSHLDHDHETKKVRGVLCHGCNVSLGHLREEIARIQGLAAYISKHKE